MRILFTACLAAALLVACTPAPVSESPVCANGFAPTGKPVTMGSESSVDLVKAIDVEWAKLDLEAMRRFYSDTCRYEWNDGDQFQGFDAFGEYTRIVHPCVVGRRAQQDAAAALGGARPPAG